MNKILKRVLAVVLTLSVLVVPMLVNASGTDIENSKFTSVMNGETLTVPAGETMYFEVGYNQAVTFDFSITGTGAFDVAVCNEGTSTWYSKGTSVTAINGKFNGKITFFESTSFFAGFSITNNSSTSKDYVLKINYPLGSAENPVAVTVGISGIKYVTVPAMKSYNVALTLPEHNVDYQLTITGQTGFGCSTGMMPTWDTDGKIVTTVASHFGPANLVIINNTTSTKLYALKLQEVPHGTNVDAAVPEYGLNKAEITDTNYYYKWDAPSNGLVKVNINSSSNWQWSMSIEPFDTGSSVYNGDKHAYNDSTVVMSEEHNVKAGDSVYITLSLYDTNEKSGTIDWSFEFENYTLSDKQITEDKNNYALSDEYEYTVFEFAPTNKGNYVLSAPDALIGIVGYFWVNANPSGETVNSDTLTWECTAVGQSILVGVVSDKTEVEITVAQGTPAPSQPTLTWTIYNNKATVSKFTTELTADKLTNVNTADNKVDTAVLGTDGFYHLNSVDGEILYIDLNHTKLSVVQAIGYGRFGAVEYENSKPVKMNDYSTAISEYINSAAMIDGDSTTMYLYPVTVDLIEMYQMAGKDPVRNWYGAEGVVGGLYDDAWMFATYYVKVADDSGNQGGSDDSNDTNNDANTGDSGNSNESGSATRPQTSDESNMILWIAVLVSALSACVVIIKIKRQYN